MGSPRRKRIRRFNARLTTFDHELSRKLCRLIGCTTSDLVRDLLHAEARRRGLFGEEIQRITGTALEREAL